MKRILFLICMLAAPLWESQAALPLAMDIRLDNEKAFLGIHYQKISEEKAKLLGLPHPYGTYVTDVLPGSAAEAAGLLPFDYLIGVDDQMTGRDQYLGSILSNYQAGDRATLHFIRKGKREKTTITFQKRMEYLSGLGKEAGEKTFLGIRADEDKAPYGAGVRVEIVGGSPADRMGLRNGDVINSFNDHPIIDWDDITAATNLVSPGENVRIAVIRDGDETVVSGQIGSYWEEKGRTIEEKAEALARKAERFGERIGREAEAFGRKMEREMEAAFDGRSDKPFLGIHIEKLSREKAGNMNIDNPYGSYVSKVLENSAAQKAGIQPFDYIYGVDEYRTGDEQDLGDILRRFDVGDEVTLHLYRDGRRIEQKVVLGSKADVREEKTAKCDKPFLGVRQDYKDGPEKGIKVGVVENSTAKELGIQDGDILLSLNDQQLFDWTDIGIALGSLQKGDALRATFLRGDTKLKGSGTIKSLGETRDCNEGFLEDLDIDIDLEDASLFSDESNTAPGPPEDRPDVSGMEVRMVPVSGQEAARLHEKLQLYAPLSNDLELLEPSWKARPSESAFELSFRLATTGNTLVQVFNEQGRKLYEYELFDFTGEFSDLVDLSQNGSGNYYLIVRQSNRSTARKIVLE